MTTVKKLIADVLKGQKELREALTPQVIEKAKKYDSMVEKLRFVKFSVKSVRKFVDSNGMNAVQITYEPAVETIVIADNDVLSSDMFKAMNEYNLITFSDMRKISAAIDDQKKVK